MENESSEQPLSVGQWMVNLLITYIPGVNLIMLIVWSASSDTPQTKKKPGICQVGLVSNRHGFGNPFLWSTGCDLLVYRRF